MDFSECLVSVINSRFFVLGKGAFDFFAPWTKNQIYNRVLRLFVAMYQVIEIKFVAVVYLCVQIALFCDAIYMHT